ncbi:hypothetical protein ABPG74_011648 [Tetrahymena malaccensis]
MNKVNNGLHRGQRSHTYISNKSANNGRNFANRDKKNLKHYLKEFMIKATQDKNLSKKVYELKIEYEQENDLKLFQLKLMPFFFDQNYAIITVDNLSNEERLKNKDDLLKVSYHLNNHCRLRVLNNVEQIIRNFIQFQKEAIQNIESNDNESIKSIFSILQSSTFQMCQRTINEVKNVQNLSFSKKKIPINSQRFSIVEQIRTILKRFSYQLHKNNQKFRLHIDTTQYEYQKQKEIYNQDNQNQADKGNGKHLNINSNSINNNLSTNNNQIQSQHNQTSNYSHNNQIHLMQQNNLNQSNNHLLTMNNTNINNLSHNINNGDESFQVFSISKYASQSHLGMHSQISQIELQKLSPKNGGRQSYYLNNQISYHKTPLSLIQIQQQQSQHQQLQQISQSIANSNKISQNQNLPQYSNNSDFDNQHQQSNQNDLQFENQAPNLNNQKQTSDMQIQNPPNHEFQQSLAFQQIKLGLRKEEIINEENEKNEEASIQNSVNQSQKFAANLDNLNINNLNMTGSTQKQARNKSVQSNEFSPYNLSHSQQKINFRQIESQLGSEANPNNSCQMSQSVDYLHLDEHVSSKNQQSNQKSYQNSFFNVNQQQKFINCVEHYSLSDKIKMPSFLNLQSNISPPHSLLQQIQQSPLSSFIHNYSSDHVLDDVDFQFLKSSKKQTALNVNLDESSQDAIPFEAKEINQENLESSLIKKLKNKMHPLIVSFPKCSLESRNLQEISDLSESCQYEISPQKLHSLDQQFEFGENSQQKIKGKNSNQILSPLKKEKTGYLSNTQSRNSLQQSNLMINDINQKEISLSSIDQPSQSQISKESSSSSQSQSQSKSLETSAVNNSLNSSYESKRVTKNRTNENKSMKSKKQKKKIYKKEKSQDKKTEKSLCNNIKERDFVYKNRNLRKSTTSISNDLHKDQWDHNLKDDVIIWQDVSRVNNILYNFIENSIIHSKQNSEILMKVIENTPPLEGEQYSSYFTIEITNTCLQDIEDVKQKIESSLEYQFHDQNLVDQIIDEETSFTLGLRSARKNLRYLGPFDQINFYYNLKKNEITTSFSIYKNIEVLYPEIGQISQTRSILSPQTHQFHQSSSSNQQPFPFINLANQFLEHHSPNLSSKYQSPFQGPLSVEKSKLNMSLLNIQTPVKKRMDQYAKDQQQSQNLGLSTLHQGLSNLTRKSIPHANQVHKEQLQLPVQNKSKSPLISFQKVTNAPPVQQTLDLSASFISRFRNNSVYNESSSKHISRDSSQNVPNTDKNKVPTQKEILNGSVRQTRVKSCYSQAIDDNISKSIQIQSPNIQTKAYSVNPIFSKISQFSLKQNHEDQMQHQHSQNFDQETIFKEKTNSLQINNEEIKNKFELTNSTSYRFSYLSGNRLVSYNTNNAIANHTQQSNSTSINQNKLNQTMNFNQAIQNNLIDSNAVRNEQKTSIIARSNIQNSPITNKNRSEKAFTFYHS